MYKIYIEKRKKYYTFIATSLFRDGSLIVKQACRDKSVVFFFFQYVYYALL